MMKKVKKGLIPAIFAFMFFGILNFVMIRNSFAEVRFIANKTVPENTLKTKAIKEIFLGDRVSWSDGQEIKFVVLKESATHAEFTKTYTQKTESQFLKFWKRQVFTGKGSMPKAVSSSKEVVDYVENTKGAIGYVSSETPIHNVKLITISD